MAEIQLQNLHKRFSDFVAVQDSSLTIRDGEFLVLLGPSGCGKTTTLRMIAGLELPSSGQILLDGEDVTFRRARERDIAFVFQLFALYPHMTVRENIAFPLLNERVPSSEVRARVAEIAAMLQIEGLLSRKVTGLSGGDRQRVALGRAIVRRPKAFLMDEPLGTLDAEFRETMCLELRALHDRLGATTVYVTHDQSEAMALADTIVVMNRGRIEQNGPPAEVFNKPVSEFVALFMGGHNIIDTASGRVAVRSDRITVGSSGAGLTGTLVDFEYQGSYGLLSLDVPQASKSPLSVMLPEAAFLGQKFVRGQPYSVSWQAHDGHPLPAVAA